MATDPNPFEGRWSVTLGPLASPGQDLVNAAPFGMAREIAIEVLGPVAIHVQFNAPGRTAVFQGDWAEGPPPRFQVQWTDPDSPSDCYHLEGVWHAGSASTQAAIGGTFARKDTGAEGPTDGSGSWVGTEQPPDPKGLTPR